MVAAGESLEVALAAAVWQYECMTAGDKTQKKFREKVVTFIERYTIHFYVITAVLYAINIPLALIVFPNTTLTLTIVVLLTGFTSAVGSLASTLIDLHQNDEIDDLNDDGLDNNSNT